MIVSARTGAHVEAPGSGEAFVLDRGKIVRALQRPASEAGLKAAVGHEVRAVVRADLDFIHQTFADALQVDDEAVVGGGAERFTKRAGPFDGRPQALAGVVAVGPVRRMTFVPLDVDQFKAAAQAVAPLAPLASIAIDQIADRDVEFLNGRATSGIRNGVVIGRRQREAFTAVGQRAAVGAKEVDVRAEVRVGGHQVGEVPPHDVVGARRHVHREPVGRERVVDANDELPSAEVH